MLRGVRDYVSARPLLALLLFIDLCFIALHVWLWSQGLHKAGLGLQFNISHDRSYPEWFGYLLWLASALACAYTFARPREPIYLAWILLFVYLFLDDATQIHEQYGYSLAIAMQWAPALALRARDFGELAVSAIAGTILLSTITFAYWRSDEAGRAFTRQLLPWLGVLIVCGVGVDMLEIQLESFGSPLNIILEVVEDGGEMIAASFLTALSVREAMRVGSEALPVAALRHWVGAAWQRLEEAGSSQ